jgi:hypothetical protein
LHVPQTHFDVFVSEQLHEGGKAHAEPEHLGSETVPQSMWCHMGKATGALCGPD